LLHRLEVGEHAAEPAVVDVRHGRALRFLAHDLACLALGAHEKERAAVRGELARELGGVLVERQRLLEVDDVDLVAVAEDVGGHLRVPVPGLMSEMDPGFQHLTHRDRHFVLLWVGSAPALYELPEEHPCRTGRKFVPVHLSKSARNSPKF
jgi:hypothetical protein